MILVGVLVATFFTLFIVPVAYSLLGERFFKPSNHVAQQLEYETQPR